MSATYSLAGSNRLAPPSTRIEAGTGPADSTALCNVIDPLVSSVYSVQTETFEG
jgi:hypothetical protein